EGTAIRIRLLHQTLLSDSEIRANPEYVNVNTYASLEAVHQPFSLPFDLFETEGELYLAKLGTTKADLVDAFRKEDPTPSPNTEDLDVAYAFLKVTDAERPLIFQQDLLNQTAYWGSVASTSSPALDRFMQAA